MGAFFGVPEFVGLNDYVGLVAESSGRVLSEYSVTGCVTLVNYSTNLKINFLTFK